MFFTRKLIIKGQSGSVHYFLLISTLFLKYLAKISDSIKKMTLLGNSP